jgi:biopolymer transport protein ExbB/TolQ
MAAMIVVAYLAGQAQVGVAQVVDEDRRIAKLAAEAESAEQHARVASEARDRADQLDAQAARYERTARRLEKNWFPNEYKTPSMLQPGYRERQHAANARLAAKETRALAKRHRQIAIDLRTAPE